VRRPIAQAHGVEAAVDVRHIQLPGMRSLQRRQRHRRLRIVLGRTQPRLHVQQRSTVGSGAGDLHPRPAAAVS
jgi:hypothetical protein